MGELAGRQMLPMEIAQRWHDTAIKHDGYCDYEELHDAVAICLGESQGRLKAHNHNPDGTDDWGPMQLNSIHEEVTQDRAEDPDWAFPFAYGLFKGRGRNFGDWVAFTSGVYLSDPYHLRASLGCMNFMSKLKTEQGLRRNQMSKAPSGKPWMPIQSRVPMIRRATLVTLYPNVEGLAQ